MDPYHTFLSYAYVDNAPVPPVLEGEQCRSEPDSGNPTVRDRCGFRGDMAKGVGWAS